MIGGVFGVADVLFATGGWGAVLVAGGVPVRTFFAGGVNGAAAFATVEDVAAEDLDSNSRTEGVFSMIGYTPVGGVLFSLVGNSKAKLRD